MPLRRDLGIVDGDAAACWEAAISRPDHSHDQCAAPSSRACGLTVTTHAITRYRERVRDVPADVARQELTAPVIERAARFGAAYVRLGTGQRVVLRENRVVTVLPKGTAIVCLGGEAERRRCGG